jgi:hypothetical protein
MRRPCSRQPSGNNVRGELIFDVGDAVAQVKLAFLEPLNLKLIGARGVLQGRDGGVKVAMLLLQSRQLFLQLPLFVSGHSYQRLMARRFANRKISRFCRLSSKLGPL